MPKSTIISQDVIIETAFEMVRQEGFSILSTRNIAKKIGCSTQPIYWCYKNMNDLKAEICKKALPYLQNVMLGYSKTAVADNIPIAINNIKFFFIYNLLHFLIFISLSSCSYNTKI